MSATVQPSPDTTDLTCLTEGCIPSNDPRKASCCRCGSRIASLESARPATRPRDLERERLITREAAQAYLSPDTLIYWSERRAESLSGEYVQDHMEVALGRDRLKDAREEAEDLRNHLVWLMEDNPDDYRVADWMEALRGIVWIYQKLST